MNLIQSIAPLILEDDWCKIYMQLKVLLDINQENRLQHGMLSSLTERLLSKETLCFNYPNTLIQASYSRTQNMVQFSKN